MCKSENEWINAIDLKDPDDEWIDHIDLEDERIDHIDFDDEDSSTKTNSQIPPHVFKERLEFVGLHRHIM